MTTTHVPTLFDSFFLGGFECSTHRLGNGRRVDVTAATGHDTHADADYRRLARVGVRAARDGFRWPQIETRAGRYDFSRDVALVRAARDAGVQVIWDLCHYGWPDDIDVFRPDFVRRFARFARAAAEVVAGETDEIPFYSPVNEVSFFAWGGGDAGYLNPFAQGRGFELKVQLARAAIEAIEAVWDVDPRARIMHADPLIHIARHPDHPATHADAEGRRLAQYQGWDLISGRLWPQIGGDAKYLDVVGVNYYSNNQWVDCGGPVLRRGDALFRPFREMLAETWERYQRPLFVAETGIEGDARPEWLAHIGDEVAAARDAGVPVEGICLYPIVNHPGWDDDRHCHNGLWDYAGADGHREAYDPLLEELRRQQRRFERWGTHERAGHERAGHERGGHHWRDDGAAGLRSVA